MKRRGGIDGMTTGLPETPWGEHMNCMTRYLQPMGEAMVLVTAGRMKSSGGAPVPPNLECTA